MSFHSNALREISLCGDTKDTTARSIPQDIPHAGVGRQTESIKGFVKQEETPARKRKRDETLKFQSRHDQPAVNAAQGADMDHIHFSEPFSGFNYTSANAYMRNDHFHLNGTNDTSYPSVYSSGNGGGYYNHEFPTSSGLVRTLSGDTLTPDTFVLDGGPDYYGATNEDHADIKLEDARDSHTVSATPAEERDFVASDSEEERPRKAAKINKDGAPRKPRQPRAKLLKWNDEDWKNVCLGIVWACGETGVQIPFDQAAQVVGEKCTAGALQQALLKLRGKQIADGYQIPNLKMAWTRKSRNAASGAQARPSEEPEANRPRKKPTRMEATQSLIVTLPRAYNDQDRQGIVQPYKWKKPPGKVRSSMLRSSTDAMHEGPAEGSASSGFSHHVPHHQNDVTNFSYTKPEMIQTSQPSLLTNLLQTHRRGNVSRGSGTLTANPAGDAQGDVAIFDYVNNTQDSSPMLHWFGDDAQTPAASQDTEYLPATPMTSHQFYSSPPATPFGNNIGFLQGMVIGGREFADLLTTEGLHDYGNSFADATDDVFTS
ncbi:uncharacterized protein EKO05_0002951 [Ascochyta rabiei]|uniref:Uncharacterized protein n=1 Tax=Didymella rabiei TaxID=5454 RepID=A0A162X402_DIDRA|nr:uncharacterized protein EKO05_0002951 [Ascochyta rabiei]KZM19338.1 hypothetical protein ST47_g9500 [Ascochyta rabiei]UPX12402.1 hypothetical protein EKO05_0002951 [Ascochyta rabiei]